MPAQEVQFTMDDGVVLDGLVSDPPEHPTPSALCIVGHPWARMGGSMRDHVVGMLARAMTTAGARVVRFNSRGAQPGTSATWTGLVEAKDYQTVLEASCRAFSKRWPKSTGIHLVLAGYSAGAVHASMAHIPTSQFALLRQSQVTYLLVSYPLGVLWVLHLMRASVMCARLDALAQQGQGIQVLFVYGDGDQFTGIERYNRTVGPLAGKSSTFRPILVEGADHFWAAKEPAQRLAEVAAAAAATAIATSDAPPLDAAPPPAVPAPVALPGRPPPVRPHDVAR